MKCGQGSPGLTRRCALDPLNIRTLFACQQPANMREGWLCFASAVPRVRLLCLATPAGCMVAKQGARVARRLTWGCPPSPRPFALSDF